MFRQLPAFSHLPRKERSPESVRAWLTGVAPDLKRWWPEGCEDLHCRFEKLFLNPCKSHLTSLFTSGLGSLSQTVRQCIDGEVGGGLSQNVLTQLLQQIPSQHPLRPLSCSFLEASCRIVLSDFLISVDHDQLMNWFALYVFWEPCNLLIILITSIPSIPASHHSVTEDVRVSFPGYCESFSWLSLLPLPLESAFIRVTS